MMRPLTIACCFALTLAAATAAAQDPAKTPAAAAPATAAAAPAAAPAAAVGNAQTGRQLTYTCQGCHGVTGYKNAYPNYHVPKIVGQSPEYLTKALSEYKSGARKHPTMQAQAQSFSDQDIADIAAFLSSAK
jgi:cytochrome c553